jgi:hypothetical protein
LAIFSNPLNFEDVVSSELKLNQVAVLLLGFIDCRTTVKICFCCCCCYRTAVVAAVVVAAAAKKTEFLGPEDGLEQQPQPHPRFVPSTTTTTTTTTTPENKGRRWRRRIFRLNNKKISIGENLLAAAADDSYQMSVYVKTHLFAANINASHYVRALRVVFISHQHFLRDTYVNTKTCIKHH